MKLLNIEMSGKVLAKVLQLEAELRELTKNKDLFITITGVRFIKLSAEIVYNAAYECATNDESVKVVKSKNFFNTSKERPYITYKQCAMYLMRNRLKISFNQIGEYFGGLDHTTAIHAANRFSELLEIGDKIAMEAYANVIKEIENKRYEVFESAS